MKELAVPFLRRPNRPSALMLRIAIFSIGSSGALTVPQVAALDQFPDGSSQIVFPEVKDHSGVSCRLDAGSRAMMIYKRSRENV
jgi:hypothetical protein